MMASKSCSIINQVSHLNIFRRQVSSHPQASPAVCPSGPRRLLRGSHLAAEGQRGLLHLPGRPLPRLVRQEGQEAQELGEEPRQQEHRGEPLLLVLTRRRRRRRRSEDRGGGGGGG